MGIVEVSLLTIGGVTLFAFHYHKKNLNNSNNASGNRPIANQGSIGHIGDNYFSSLPQKKSDTNDVKKKIMRGLLTLEEQLYDWYSFIWQVHPPDKRDQYLAKGQEWIDQIQELRSELAALSLLSPHLDKSLEKLIKILARHETDYKSLNEEPNDALCIGIHPGIIKNQATLDKQIQIIKKERLKIQKRRESN